LRQGHPPPDDPDKRQILGAAALLNDFMRQTLQGTVNFRRGHQLCLFDDAHGRVIVSLVAAGRSIGSAFIERKPGRGRLRGEFGR